jgi:hypothetical protein
MSKTGDRSGGWYISGMKETGMTYHENVLAAIGNTPLIRLGNIERTEKLEATLLAKVEYLNPGGSVKDRPAIKMLEVAEEQGLLKPGGTVVEPTSGNTGAGLALAAAVKGYKCICVMPEKASKEKQDLLKAMGAEVVVTPSRPPEDPESYYSVAERLAEEIPGGFKPGQYENPANPLAPLRDNRTRVMETDRWSHHPLRGRNGNLRNHLRNRTVPERTEPRSTHSRRGPGRLHLLRPGEHPQILRGRRW